MPTQLTIEPGEYLVSVACPADLDANGVGVTPPPAIKTMAIPEDGNQPYRPPSREFPIGSSGYGVGVPSGFFQYPVYQSREDIERRYYSGEATGYMPGGWRPPNYSYSAPQPPQPSLPKLAPGIDTPMDWIYGFDLDAVQESPLSAFLGT